MTVDGRPTACVLTGGRFATKYAKTAHGLVRGTERFRIVAVVDAESAGEDAGDVLDGRRREIPVVGSVAEVLEQEPRPDYGIIGVATTGGVLPADMRGDVLSMVQSGMSMVNGLHQYLSGDEEIAAAAKASGAELVDLRKPKPAKELRFWRGKSVELATPRVAVIGTDCAIGKRTTTWLLRDACRQRGVKTEMIYTGQTGWLQGIEHGFILDSTMNDFVSGELEAAILECAEAKEPELILLEGQSALRNPAGPCGAELLLSGGAKGVVLQHAPGREFFEDLEKVGCRIPSLRDEVALVRMYGSEVWAVCLSEHDLEGDEAERQREKYAAELGVPVFLPLRDGMEGVADAVLKKIGKS